MPVARLVPRGCTDAIYSPGGLAPVGMAALSNLVPAPDSPHDWVPRPAAVAFANSTNQFISCQIVVGSILYGMRASTAFPGFDEPFAFNLVTGAYIVVTGATGANTPSSAPTTGTWQPPHAEIVGVYIVITHTGFSGTGANFFGAINITTPTAPVWTAQNTATNLLPSRPVWVIQYQQRAHFFCNPNAAQPATLATDVLNPLTRSAAVAGFILTYGDNVPLLCGGTFTFTQLAAGGIMTAAYIFKMDGAQIFQITGDFAGGAAGAAGSIALQALNTATGTFAPNTVIQTPQGLAFMAPDGLRVIDSSSAVGDPIGYAGSGVCLPFTTAVIPSRMAAAANGTTIRITVQNAAAAGSPDQEWDFDLTRKIFHGPHTFPISLISYFSQGGAFIVSPRPALAAVHQIWSSQIVPNANSVYTENGSSYTCSYQSALYPDRDEINELTSIKSVLYVGRGSGNSTYNVSMIDRNGDVIAFTQLPFLTVPVLWGGFQWGSGQSLGASSQIAGIDVPWPAPFSFDRISVLVTIVASSGVRIGSFHMLYEETGYTVLP